MPRSSDDAPSDSTPLSSSNTLSSSSPPTKTGELRAPRYIPLPDVLFTLRRRFPSVMESVCLECTRCHQWVAEDVLRAIPDEIPDATVVGIADHVLRPAVQEQMHRSLAVAPHRVEHKKARGDAAGVPTMPGPAGSSGGGSGETTSSEDVAAAEARTWHSQRLREKTEEALKQQQQEQQRRQKQEQRQQRKGHTHSLASQAEKVLLSAVQTRDGNTVAKPSPGDALGPRFIPNPVTFVCRWSCCAMGDRMTDLRHTWTGEVLKLADELAESRRAGGGGGGVRTATRSGGPQHDVSSSDDDDDEEGEEATREEKVVESHADNSHATGKVASTAAAGAVDKGKKEKEEEKGSSASDSASSPSPSPVSRLPPPTAKERRDALNDALERELGLRRSSRLAERRAGADTRPRLRPDGHWQGLGRCLSTPALLGLLEPSAVPLSSSAAPAALHVSSSPSSVANSSAATAASATVAGGGGALTGADAQLRRQQWLHHTWVQSAASYLLHNDAAATLSAFCWVVCEACGKVRRVAQPFPGGAPFVCALSAFSGGTCAVSEADGLVMVTEALLREQLVDATALSPFMELVPPYAVGPSPVIEEPILHAVKAVVEAEAAACVPSSSTTTAAATATTASSAWSPSSWGSKRAFGALVARCLPLLRDLTVALRKRSTGMWARQLALTPVEIRRKRERVLLEVFLRAEERTAATAAAERETQKALVKDQKKAGKRAAKAVTSATVTRAVSIASSSSPSPTPVVSTTTAGTRGRRKQADSSTAATRPARKRARTTDEADEKEDARGTGDVVVVDTPSVSQDSPVPASVAVRAESDVQVETHTAAAAAAQPGGEEPRRGQKPLAKTADVTAASEEGVVPPAVPVKRGRGRPRKLVPPPSATASASGVQGEEEEEVIHWVQCDQCGKWRVIPEPIADSVDFWTCSMRVDPVTGHRTACREMDDEKRMAREGTQVREV